MMSKDQISWVWTGTRYVQYSTDHHDFRFNELAVRPWRYMYQLTFAGCNPRYLLISSDELQHLSYTIHPNLGHQRAMTRYLERKFVCWIEPVYQIRPLRLQYCGTGERGFACFQQAKLRISRMALHITDTQILYRICANCRLFNFSYLVSDKYRCPHQIVSIKISPKLHFSSLPMALILAP